MTEQEKIQLIEDLFSAIAKLHAVVQEQQAQLIEAKRTIQTLIETCRASQNKE